MSKTTNAIDCKIRKHLHAIFPEKESYQILLKETVHEQEIMLSRADLLNLMKAAAETTFPCERCEHWEGCPQAHCGHFCLDWELEKETEPNE